MKLLFDENLSPRLALRLADLFPDSTHVQEIGLKAAADLPSENMRVSTDL